MFYTFQMIYKGSYEDLIYILIGVIWIGYSIYKGVMKSKEHKPAGKVKPAKTKSKSFLDTFLEELTEQGEKPTEMEYIPPEKEKITEKEFVAESYTETKNGKEKILSYDDYDEKSNFKKATDVYDTSAETGVEVVKIEEFREEPKKRKATIDLKKAVIYSEILNPRYF